MDIKKQFITFEIVVRKLLIRIHWANKNFIDGNWLSELLKDLHDKYFKRYKDYKAFEYDEMFANRLNIYKQEHKDELDEINNVLISLSIYYLN